MNLQRIIEQGGGYNLPYLLHVYNDLIDVYVINDTEDLTYNGKLYKASTFDYEPEKDGSAALNIEIVQAGNQIINILEGARLGVDVVGVLEEDGRVDAIEAFKHSHGSASWDGVALSVKLEADDRLEMTFPALIFNAYNARGL